MTDKYKKLSIIYSIIAISTFLIFGLGIIFAIPATVLAGIDLKKNEAKDPKPLAFAIFSIIINFIFLVITMFLLYYYYNF